MGNNKDVSLKAKLSVDLNTFKDFENKVKSLSKTFKNVQIEIASSSQGMDKTIQQAFFGKRGTDRTTIKGFFKKQFGEIKDAFTAEIKAAAKAMVDIAGTTSAKSIADMIKVLTKQEKEIEKLTNKNTKLAAKSTSGTAKKAKKYQLSDDDKAFRSYYLAERNFKEKVAKEKGAAIYGDIKAEQKATQMQLAASKAASKMRVQNKYADIKAEQKANQIQIAAAKAATKLKSENLYNDIKAEQKANQIQIAAAKAATKLKSENLYNDIKAEQKTDTMLRKQAAARQKYKTQLLYDDIKAEQKANQMRYAENKRLEDEKKRLEAEKLENAKNVIRQATGWGDGGGWLGGIKDAPVKSFFDGIIKGAGGMKGAIESALGKLKELVKYLAIVGAAGIGGFIALGAVVQKLAAGVLFATEKMRGYEIALFGMMKTQDGVNELMEKAFKVTKNLPISYEQVYQSTKAFTLIGPVRDMLKNVGETETVLKRMYSITMALSQIEPEWGLAGAQFSLREALSGDLRSLQRRFEIPVNLIYSKDGRSLRELKNDPEAMSQALSDYFKEFYNEETLGMAANQFGAILGKIEGKWFEFQSAIGNAGFYDLFVGKLKEVRDELEAFAGSAEFKDVTNRISNSLGSSLNSLLSIIEKLVVGFGSLFGINVQATNAFQSAVDVVEKFAAVLRIIDRIITEVDIFGYLNKALKTTAELFDDIGKFAFKVFRSVKRDIDSVLKVLEKFSGATNLFGEQTGRGLFYLWLFGKDNVFAMITGFGTTVIATIYSFKSAFAVTMAANTLLAEKFGFSLLKWGGLIAATIAGIEQIAQTFKFAFNSIDDKLESSIFYRMWAWLTGETTTDDIEKKLSGFKTSFNLKSDVNDSLKVALTKEMGFKNTKEAQKLINNPDAFMAAVSGSAERLKQFDTALTMVEEDLKTVITNGTASRRPLSVEQNGQIQNLRNIVSYFKDHPDEMAKLSGKHQRQAELNDSYSQKHMGYLEYMISQTKAFADAAYDAGSTVKQAVTEMIQPALSKADEALFKARTPGTEIMTRGDVTLNNMDSGAKLVGAELLNVFQAAGFGVGLTSGWRDDAKKGSLHNVDGTGYAFDYQPNIGGKLLTAADVQKPEFEALVNALKANENIAELILEYKDKSIFGGKFEGLTKETASAKNGPVIHIGFKKDIAKTEEGFMSMLTNFKDSYNILGTSLSVINDEWNKPSKQLPQKDFLHQNFQRATEFIKNVYTPTMDAIKNGYKDGAELIATSYKEFDEVFKSEEGVAKFGPARINSLETRRKALMAQAEQIKNKAGGKDNIEYDLINQGIMKGAKDIFDYSYTSLMSGSLPKLKNIAGIIEERQSLTKEYIDFLADLHNKINLLTEQITKEVEITNDAWGSVLEGKSYDYIDIVGSNIKEFQNDLMAKMAEEAAAQTVYNGLADGLAPKDQSLFYQAMGTVTSTMKSRNITFEEAIKLTDITDASTKALMKTTVEHYKVIEQNNLAYKMQRMEIEKNLSAIKRINNIQKLSNEQNRYMGTKEERTAYYSQYAALLSEGQGVSAGDSFSKGIQASQNEFLTSFEVMYEAGKELNSSLMQTFETGFFGLMTGEIANIGDMFRNVAKSIQHSIFKIISQMAAISATKLILGVDIQGALSGGQSSGGLGGLLGGQGGLGGLIGGLFGSNKTTASGVDLSSVATSLGGGSNTITGNLLSKAASFLPGSNILDTVIKSGTAKKAASGGLLGKLGIGKITPLSGLGITAALSFLSSPGRLFGGTKDKTAGAQANLADYNARRAASVGRRGSDAIGYYMGGNVSPIQNYEFGGIGYNTWTSGDGWFKGPKEKHAATDPSAYLKSMDKYYSMLLEAGKGHYTQMKNINKLAERNQLASLRQQQSFDNKKLTMIQAEYDRYASAAYTDADKYEKMDDFRNQKLEQDYANWQLDQEIIKLGKDTKYAEMEYLTYMQSGGEDQMAMAKTSIEIQKMKIAELDAYTLEWYNAKMELFDAEKDLADSLKDSAKALKANISTGVKEIYSLGINSPYPTFSDQFRGMGPDINATNYANMLTLKDKIDQKDYTASDILNSGAAITGSKVGDKYQWNEVAKYRYQDFGFFSDYTETSDLFMKTRKDPENYKMTSTTVDSLTPVSKTLKGYVSKITINGKTYTSGDTITFDKDIIETYYKKEYLKESLYTIGDVVNGTLEEAAAYVKEKLETDAENFLTNYKLDVEIQQIYGEIGDAMRGVNDNLREAYEKISRTRVNYDGDVKLGLMTDTEREIAGKELDLEEGNFALGLANSVGEWIKQGYLSTKDKSVKLFSNAISNGIDDISMGLYESLQLESIKMKTKGDLFSSVKDMENFDVFNQVMGMDEMKDFKRMMNIGDAYAPMTETYRVDDMIMTREVEFPGDMSGLGGTDPYTAWFEFNKAQINSRIEASKDKEGMESEYYQAEFDLYTLLIDNANRLKEKSEEMNRSLEDMLGKMEETMRMRIAEERQTTKGDVYFVDVGATRDTQKMFDRMVAAFKSNDPEAIKAMEELKKKMLGIGR